MKERYIISLLLLFVVFVSFSTVEASELKVVASTTWVGAMVEAAGVSDVTVLAPIDMRHPAEYDFTPSDIRLALEADYLVYAGYEPFVNRLVDAADFPQERVITVHTNNSPPILKDSVAALAKVFGTEQQYSRWEQELNALVQRLQTAASQKQIDEIRVAVQSHQRLWVEWLGYDVVASFGPEELTASKISEVMQTAPEMIVDNWHSAQGEVFRSEGRDYVSLINFPGPDNTGSLLEVLERNGRELGLLE